MRILIIEDEKKSAAFLRKGMTESGFITDVAEDGEDGLFKALNLDYDLVVLDAMLPLMWRLPLWICTASMTAMLLCASPAQAGPPFATDDPEPVDYQHWEVYGFTAGVREHGNTSGWLPGVEVNYGAAPELQLHVIATYAFDAPNGASRRAGFGDTELGAKYRFVDPGKDDWWPQIGIFPLLELHTGNAARGLGAGYTQTFLPVWVQKDCGEWTTYGGGGYWINPGPGNRNYWYTGWLLQRQITKSLMLGGEIFHQGSSADGREASFGFSFGGVYDFTEHDHLLFSAGHGGLTYAVDGGNITRPFTYYLGFQWTS